MHTISRQTFLYRRPRSTAPRSLAGGIPMENVVIDPACFVGLVTSAVEAYNRETNGFLIGAERARKLRRAPRDVAVLKAAYPIQTADRKVNWVANGNGRAFDRARH